MPVDDYRYSHADFEPVGGQRNVRFELSAVGSKAVPSAMLVWNGFRPVHTLLEMFDSLAMWGIIRHTTDP